MRHERERGGRWRKAGVGCTEEREVTEAPSRWLDGPEDGRCYGYCVRECCGLAAPGMGIEGADEDKVREWAELIMGHICELNMLILGHAFGPRGHDRRVGGGTTRPALRPNSSPRTRDPQVKTQTRPCPHGV